MSLFSKMSKIANPPPNPVVSKMRKIVNPIKLAIRKRSKVASPINPAEFLYRVELSYLCRFFGSKEMASKESAFQELKKSMNYDVGDAENYESYRNAHEGIVRLPKAVQKSLPPDILKWLREIGFGKFLWKEI